MDRARARLQTAIEVESNAPDSWTEKHITTQAIILCMVAIKVSALQRCLYI